MKDVVKFVKKSVTRVSVFAVALFFAVKANATPTVADIWSAADTSTLTGNVVTILVVMVGIALAFVAYKLVKKAITKA